MWCMGERDRETDKLALLIGFSLPLMIASCIPWARLICFKAVIVGANLLRGNFGSVSNNDHGLSSHSGLERSHFIYKDQQLESCFAFCFPLRVVSSSAYFSLAVFLTSIRCL